VLQKPGAKLRQLLRGERQDLFLDLLDLAHDSASRWSSLPSCRGLAARIRPPGGLRSYARNYARDRPVQAPNHPPPAKDPNKNPSASPRLTEGFYFARLLDRPVC
jgi:hypothetical protein